MAGVLHAHGARGGADARDASPDRPRIQERRADAAILVSRGWTGCMPSEELSRSLHGLMSVTVLETGGCRDASDMPVPEQPLPTADDRRQPRLLPVPPLTVQREGRPGADAAEAARG